MNIILKVKERGIDFRIHQTESKSIYVPKLLASEWIRKEIKEDKDKIEYPHISNPLSVSDKSVMKISKNAVGFMVNLNNNVYENLGGCSIFTAIGTRGNASCGFSIIPSNLKKVVALYVARKTIKPDWKNCKDEYCEPNTTHPDYEQWNNDAIVYALFGPSSNQSSLRQVDYKDKKWDIKNEFFWLSNKEIKELAEKHGFDDMYKDALKFDADRHVYTMLQSTNLSPDAKELLDMATSLIKKSMEKREESHYAGKEYHLNAWDAGWYQIRKGILEKHFPLELKEFTLKFKAFEERMREGVYKFGFLL